jgi:prevent-host-death family protein
MVLMKATTLVEAKAHLSELVDRAERKGQLTLICRHGKPAAAIVPVDVATSAEARATARLSEKEASALLDRMASRALPEMTIDEALGRERLDRAR